MFIKKIRMTGYKRFHDLTIDLGDNPRRIIALVGPNGCGKSSVFDAMIYHLTAYIGSFGNGSNTDYHYHSLKQEPGYNYQNIELLFNEGTFQEILTNMQISKKERSIFSFRSSFRYNTSLKITESRAVSEIIFNNYGASNASDIDQRIEEDYRRLLAKYNHYRDKNDLQPSKAKTDIIGDLNNSIKKCLDLEIDNLGNIEANEGTLYFKKSDYNTVFDFNVLSSGEKEVIDILLDLYLRKDIYTESIYIIDEPELHLNTAIQRSLLTEINKLVPQNCQIWLATHSIGFLRSLQEELKYDSQIIEFKADYKWASETYLLKPSITSRSMWQSIFSTALEDLTTLICPKTIVYCEGRVTPRIDGGEQGLDANVFNTIFALSYPDVLFISSGGNTELDQRSDIAIAILSKVFPKLSILVLKDRDMASGKITDEHIRQIYLQNNPDNHRVLKRFEIENYLYDKEILVAYCKKNDLSFNEEKYNITVTDVVNQNLKDTTGFIKSCCNISSSINSEKFKLNLAEFVLDSTGVYKELEEVIFGRK